MGTPSTKRDYYEVLGVGRAASDDEIKKAYRRLALQYHPDRNGADDAAARFKEVTEAYQVLSDGEKRRLYDRYGHSAFERTAGMGSVDFRDFAGISIDEIFETFFGTPGSRGARQRVQRGVDLRYDLTLTLEEAVFGAEKEIAVNKHAVCPRCSGDGMEPGSQPEVCPKCSGTGEVRRMHQSIFGQIMNVTICDGCNGEGSIVANPCHECRGRGLVRKDSTLRVSVPAGSDDGLQIRLAGEGEPATRGGLPGHLYIVLHVQPHRYFKRQGNDLILEVPINVAQAALGAELKVPTLDGKQLSLKVPVGTQSGRIVRLRGEGVPYLRERGRGDLQVHLKVRVPTDLTDEQKKLFKQLSATFDADSNTPTENRSFFDKVKDVFGG